MAKFIFKKKELISNIEKLQEAFLQRDINFQIFYSVKTNFSDQVLETINDHCSFEIVSAHEWEKVKKFSPKEIILNGPSKSLTLVEAILESNIEILYINIDNDTDIQMIKALDSVQLKKIRLGLRVYLNRPGIWNRFGFDIESERASNLAKKLKYKIEGIHFHFSTNNFRINNYKEMFAAIHNFSRQNSLNLKYIDIGGGLPGASDILFSNTIYEKLPMLVKSEVSNEVKIFSEVGRNLVENVFNLETSIVSLKYVDVDNIDVVIDSNIMHFPCFWEKKYSIEHVSDEKKGSATTSNIFGNSCMQIDKIAESFQFTRMPKVGDGIILTNVGAYSLSQASNFISEIPTIFEEEDFNGTISSN